VAVFFFSSHTRVLYARPSPFPATHHLHFFAHTSSSPSLFTRAHLPGARSLFAFLGSVYPSGGVRLTGPFPRYFWAFESPSVLLISFKRASTTYLTQILRNRISSPRLVYHLSLSHFHLSNPFCFQSISTDTSSLQLLLFSFTHMSIHGGLLGGAYTSELHVRCGGKLLADKTD